MKKVLITPCVVLVCWVLVGCSGGAAAPIPNTFQNNPTQTSQIPTTAAASSSKVVTIAYSGTQVTQLGSGLFPETPGQGNIFAVVTFSITNWGYTSFSVGPFYLDIIVNNIKYSSSVHSYELSNSLSSADVINGGALTGSLAYEVPVGNTVFTPYYDGIGSYNIQWNAQ